MAAPTCPTCKKPVLPRAENPMFPFCCQRCRAVDMGKWLGEEYRVTSRNSDEVDDTMSGGEGDGSDGNVRH